MQGCLFKEKDVFCSEAGGVDMAKCLVSSVLSVGTGYTWLPQTLSP